MNRFGPIGPKRSGTEDGQGTMQPMRLVRSRLANRAARRLIRTELPGAGRNLAAPVMTTAPAIAFLAGRALSAKQPAV